MASLISRLNDLITAIGADIKILKETFTKDTVNSRIYPFNSTYDFIIGGSSTEYVTGTELKMFFDKSKAALRAGGFTNANSDDANRGNYSVALGYNNKASGVGSVALGYQTLASADYSVALNEGSTASGTYAHASGSATASANESMAHGSGCTASAANAIALGRNVTVSGTAGFGHGFHQTAHGAIRSSQYAHGGGLGEAQFNRFVGALNTTNATPAVITFDQAAVALTGAGTNVLTLPVSKGHKFKVHVIARRTGTDAHATWEITGAIVRYSSGNAKFISTPLVESDKESAASAWDCAVSINTSNATNNYLAITCTGAASSTIKWALMLETLEFV